MYRFQCIRGSLYLHLTIRGWPLQPHWLWRPYLQQLPHAVYHRAERCAALVVNCACLPLPVCAAAVLWRLPWEMANFVPAQQSRLCSHVAGVRITNSFIGVDVKLCEGCTVSDGCVISSGCVIGPGHVVPPYTRVTLCSPALRGGDDSSEETEAPTRRLEEDASDDDDDAAWGPSDEVLTVRPVLPHCPSSGSHRRRCSLCTGAEPGVWQGNAQHVRVQVVRQVRAGTSARAGFFDSDAVGSGGAGFQYAPGTATPPVDILTSIALPPADLARQRVDLLAVAASDRDGGGDRGGDGDGADDDVAGDPEAMFKREVQETLLRTMVLAQDSNKAKESMTNNAVIELNGLKIAGAHLARVASPAPREDSRACSLPVNAARLRPWEQTPSSWLSRRCCRPCTALLGRPDA